MEIIYHGTAYGSELLDSESRRNFYILLNKRYHYFTAGNHAISIPVITCKFTREAIKRVREIMTNLNY